MDQRRRQEMGYWWLQQQEKLARQQQEKPARRPEFIWPLARQRAFIRQQAEAKARAAAEKQAQQSRPQAPSAQQTAVAPATAPRVGEVKPGPGRLRRLLGVIFLLVAIVAGILMLAAGFGSAFQVAVVFLLILVSSLVLRRLALGRRGINEVQEV